MNTTRRHHFVPQMILRRFTDASGMLHIHDRRRSDSTVYATSPNNAFVEKDLNSIRNQDGTLDVQLESGFSELEGVVNPIIDRIVDRALSGKKPALSGVQLSLWNVFISYQQKRAPDVFEKMGVTKTYPDYLLRRVDEIERDIRPLTNQEKKDIFSHRMYQNVSVMARSKGGGLVLEALARRGLAIAVLDSPKRSFVIGDYPFARIGHSTNLNDPRCELWFPISSKVAVSPWGKPNSEEFVRLNREQVRQLNETIWKQSNLIAGRSERLVRSLASFSH